MGTVIQDAQQSNDDHYRRWNRTRRAHLFDQYLVLQTQGHSLRQAAQALEVPRSTLQAWRAYHESLDEHPAVGAFFPSAPGLAFLHRLVVAIHLVCTEVGACGMRLVWLLLQLTGLDRFVAASYGAQHQVNCQVEEAIVTYRREESARLAQDMPAKALTLAKDETFTGGLCLVAAEPKSNDIVLEQAAPGRDQGTWQALMEQALAGLNCQVIQATSDEAPGLRAYVEHHLGAHHYGFDALCPSATRWGEWSAAIGAPHRRARLLPVYIIDSSALVKYHAQKTGTAWICRSRVTVGAPLRPDLRPLCRLSTL